MNNTPKHLTHAKLAEHTRAAFLTNLAWATVILVVSLAAGMSGYHWLAPMPWVDAFVNAAMLLGGMGPVDPLGNDNVKVFAGIYAMYCGVVFIATAGLLILPVANHVLHRFHLDQKTE
jgi:hypothetical protein